MNPITASNTAANATPYRVLRIITRLNIGGPARHTLLLSEGLRARGFETLLVTGSLAHGEGDMQYLAAGRNVRIHPLAALQREVDPARDAAALWALIRLCRRFRPHIIHTHTSKAGLLGRIAAILCRTPITVHTYHGHVFDGYFGTARTGLFLNLERMLARFSARLIALSERQKNELSHIHRVAAHQRFSIIPLGFEHLDQLQTCKQEQRGVLRQKLGLAADCPLVGMVGRLVEIKRPSDFIAAAARAAATHPQVHFVLAGDGYLRPSLQTQAERLGIGERVHFLGWLRDLAPLYADLDVYVLTSLNEGTPVSVIEALAAGVPVVSTAVGGVPDVLAGGRWGTLVEPQDPAALAAAIGNILECKRAPLSDPHGKSALRSDSNGSFTPAFGLAPIAEIQRQTLARFAADRLLDDIETLYRNLLERK
jgi:glycosyltransferase involved in cell wall biosynthesis